MNRKIFSTLLFAALFSHFGASPMAAEIRQDLLGDPAPPDAAHRSITIQKDTRYVHVEGGEIVRFNAGDKTFAWNFSGPLTVSSFNLQRIAPPGALPHQVQVIIAPNPRFMNP